MIGDPSITIKKRIIINPFRKDGLIDVFFRNNLPFCTFVKIPLKTRGVLMYYKSREMEAEIIIFAIDRIRGGEVVGGGVHWGYSKQLAIN